MIWRTARIAEALGVGSFLRVLLSAHLHTFRLRMGQSVSGHVRRYPGSLAPPAYRDRRAVRYRQSRKPVRLPAIIPSRRPTQVRSRAKPGDDDWSETLSDEDWQKVETFMRKFVLVRRYVDFVTFTVGGESRRVDLNPRSGGKPEKLRGIEFIVPRGSLMETATWGYFDDLLIGNFMKTRLINTQLYPRFTPLVAKIGGNAKVYTRAEYIRFLGRYARRNPIGTASTLLSIEVDQVWVPWFRRAAEGLGIKRPLKYLYRKMLGDPVVADPT